MSRQNSLGIDVLKAAAALLIINSHLETFDSRPYFSADGLLGNTLFFFTTGFTLAGSLDRHPSESLVTFLWKRLSRLYPSVWMVMLVLPVHTVPWGGAFTDILHALAYPTYYTFVASILPMYPMFFLLCRWRGMQRHGASIGWLMLSVATGMAVYAEWQEGHPGVSWGQRGTSLNFHFFGAMLLGGHAARKGVSTVVSRCLGRHVAIVVGLAFLYLALRLLAVPSFSIRVGGFADYLALGSLFCAVFLGMAVVRLVDGHDWLRFKSMMLVITWLSAHTWETYLLHYGVSYFAWIKSMSAPWSIMVVFAVTLMLAPILKRLASLRFARNVAV